MSRLSILIFTSIFAASWNTYATADQTAEQLPELFEQLQASSTPATAARFESQIWQYWLEAPDVASDSQMKQVSKAMAGADLAVALSLANQLVDNYPDYAEAWNKRATIHYLMGDNTASVADIRETIALEPRHFGAISGLGLIFMREQNLDAALDAFEKVLEISPASINAQRSVARLRNELEREI